MTPEQQQTGEMFRNERPGRRRHAVRLGRAARARQMWMQNTRSPLDMVFINADGTIRQSPRTPCREVWR